MAGRSSNRPSGANGPIDNSAYQKVRDMQGEKQYEYEAMMHEKPENTYKAAKELNDVASKYINAASPKKEEVKEEPHDSHRGVVNSRGSSTSSSSRSSMSESSGGHIRTERKPQGEYKPSYKAVPETAESTGNADVGNDSLVSVRQTKMDDDNSSHRFRRPEEHSQHPVSPQHTDATKSISVFSKQPEPSSGSQSQTVEWKHGDMELRNMGTLGEQQKAYQDMMAGKMANAEPEKAYVPYTGKDVASQIINNPTSGSGGGQPAGVPMPGGIRVIADTASNSRMKVSSEEKVSGADIKISDENKKSSLLRTVDVIGGIMTKSDYRNVAQNYPQKQIYGATLGAYAGGRTGGIYRKSERDNVTSVSSYASIFGNKQLAEKCGVVYDENMQRLSETTVANIKSGKIDRERILRSLMNEGYSIEEAGKYADSIIVAAKENNGRDVYIHDGKNVAGGIRSRGMDVTSDMNMLKKIGTTAGNKRGKMEIRKSGDKFVVYKNVGAPAQNTVIRIEKSTKKVGRITSNYAVGAMSQGSGEAGRGLSNVESAYRLTRIALPSVSSHVDKVFQAELKEHYRNFVTFPSGDRALGMQQWTVDEMKKHLTNTLGFDAELVGACRHADDFSSFAKGLLSNDKKHEEMYSVGKLTKEQRNFLQLLTKSRSVTQEERLRVLTSVMNGYGVRLEFDRGHYAVQKAQSLMNKVNKIYGKGNVPEDLKAAIEEYTKIMKNRVYEGSPGGKQKVFQLLMLAKNSIERHGGDAGQGISQSMRVFNLSKMTIVSYVKIKWLKAQIMREIAQKGLLLIAKSNLVAAKAAQKLRLDKFSKALNKTGTVLNKGSVKFKGANRKINDLAKHGKARAHDWIREHNPLRKAGRKAGKYLGDKVKGTQAYKNFINSKFAKVMGKLAGGGSKVAGAFASVFRAIGALKALIIKILAIAGGILLLVIFMSYFLNTISAMISSVLNINSQEYDTKQYHANSLKTYYEADINSVSEYANSLHDPSYNAETNPHVDHVEGIYFEFIDYKDFDKYKEMISENQSFDFLQSSNNGEIMSMATVKFSYDLGSLKDKWFSDDPKKNKQFKLVEEYMQQLFYGSHQLAVKVEVQTFSSDDVVEGETVSSDESYNYSVYTVYATYKTYYFNYLFSCPLLSAPQREISIQSEVGIPTGIAQSWDSIYFSLREAGLSHNGAAGAMSNMAHEAGDKNNWRATNGPNPTAGNAEGTGGYGICQWTSSGGRKGKMHAWCKSQGFDSSSTSGQLAYMLYEINNIPAYSDTKNAVYSTSKSAYDIGNVFGDNFEVYGGGQEATRGGLATTIANYYDAYKDDWSDLMSVGDTIAEIAMAQNGKIHYTQGESEENDYVGYRTFSLETAVNGFADRSCGTDCSGFVKACYLEAGVTNSVPQSTSGYTSYTADKLSTAEAVPGDIAWKSGHCGIVTGDGNTMELHKCYFDQNGNCTKDCSPGKLTNFSCVYRLWD